MNRNPVSKVLSVVVIGTIIAVAFAGMAWQYIDNKKAQNESIRDDGLLASVILPGIDGDDDTAGGDYVERNYDGTYKVVEVVDGDTIKVQYGDEVKKVRLIGIDTPETVDPDTEKECYGEEASSYLKEKINGKEVDLYTDSSQGNEDKYSRLLRYAVYNHADMGMTMVAGGYAKEYTYDGDYFYGSIYRAAEIIAKAHKLGVWSDQCQEKSTEEQAPVANNTPSTPNSAPVIEEPQNCNIKGNISYYGGQKIYHVPGQMYYDATEIDESQGERWCCSEAEAQAAGWRKSKQ